MAPNRQDAWTEEDDLFLAEVVLQHIKEGNTQLAAFREVGLKLGRTSSACGFRWNSFVRKKYRHVIEDAKQIRKEKGKAERKQSVDDEERSGLESAINEVIYFLNKIKERDEYSLVSIEVVQAENIQLKEKVKNLEKKVLLLEKEYRALFEFMDKKRGLVIQENPEEALLRERNVIIEK